MGVSTVHAPVRTIISVMSVLVMRDALVRMTLSKVWSNSGNLQAGQHVHLKTYNSLGKIKQFCKSMILLAQRIGNETRGYLGS